MDIMPISDFWVQALLSSTNPSPVPSTTSCFSNDENLENDAFKSSNNFLGGMPMLWNAGLVQQFLNLYQLQQQQQNFQQNENLKMSMKLLQSFSNVPQREKDPIPSRKRPLAQEPRRSKVRRIGEDTVTSSPVSGMFIKEESDVKSVEELQKEADQLDDTAAYVEVTDESRKKIGNIPNFIGDCVCRLCKVKYDDVFKLAQHKCPRIAHQEYKCTDCEKIFSCPANLASHRRWHKPRLAVSPTTPSIPLNCQNCFTVFPTKKLLKAHSMSCQRSPLQSLLSRVIPTV